jgi:hypothetical protein
MVAFSSPPASGYEEKGISIEMVSPVSNSTISNQTPVIEISYSSPNGIDPAATVLVVGDTNVTEFTELVTVTESGVTYPIPTTFALEEGLINVTIRVTDNQGTTVEANFTFTVDLAAQEGAPAGPTLKDVAIWVLAALGVAGAAAAIGLIYLRRVKGLTTEKFLVRHPIPRGVFIFLLPTLGALLFLLVGFAFFGDAEGVSSFQVEYIGIIALFIALVPYSIYAQREKKRIARYERAYSQFLFELADAMRGGIDPSKSIIELAKTDTGVLSKHLAVAARGIEMGRPFEEMLMVMVKPIKSKLVHRYASLVGESAKVGGEISMVVHRAAKDMDDLIKINEERSQNLGMQATTIYIAFGVLIIIIYQLISLYPSIGQMDLGSILGNGGSTGSGASSASATSARMDVITLKRRFLHLSMMVGLGNGLLIGLIVNGKLKYGLLHGLIMVLATLVFFILMII